MRLFFAMLFGLLTQVSAYAQHSPILAINRSVPKTGDEAKLEQKLRLDVQLCAKHTCPRPYLAMEPLTGPMEVWSLVLLDSMDEVRQEEDYYFYNDVFFRHRLPLRMTSTSFFSYRPDLNRGAPWKIGQGRFLVLTISKKQNTIDGSVFAAPDGTRAIVSSVASREDADAIASSAGPEAVIFEVRPELSFPATAWVNADPAFWASARTPKDVRHVE